MLCSYTFFDARFVKKFTYHLALIMLDLRNLLTCYKNCSLCLQPDDRLSGEHLCTTRLSVAVQDLIQFSHKLVTVLQSTIVFECRSTTLRKLGKMTIVITSYTICSTEPACAALIASFGSLLHWRSNIICF